MHSKYSNPLISRYASEEMAWIFSEDNRFQTWRKLWVALAKTQKELGVEVISDAAIASLENNIENLNYQQINEYEYKFRHDVMANIHAYGDQVGEARAIIHLGATSAYVQDNGDLIIYREALILLEQKIAYLLKLLGDFCLKYSEVPTLGYTHFQPAQLTTVGKRACLWTYSLYTDLVDLRRLVSEMPFRGVKGTTGTQASFKSLFNDFSKVKQLDEQIAKKMGFASLQPVSGQTYDRKLDSKILSLLSGIAQSSLKFTNDLRLLQHEHEIEEPFGENQVGSSAMAYKQNPMRSERISSLAKFVISLESNGALVASTQWLERTLDDSANRRLSLPQSFLTIDGILNIWINIIKGIRVNESVIKTNVQRELPFMITEEIIMQEVAQGNDRQIVHEAIRQASLKAIKEIKEEGKSNNLISYLAQSSEISLSADQLHKMLNPNLYTGYASEQTQDFIENTLFPYIEPLIKKEFSGELLV